MSGAARIATAQPVLWSEYENKKDKCHYAMIFRGNFANFVNMKSDITFLPERKQRDLHQLVGLIREEVKDVVMIILYGSYATDTYVERDIRRDYGGGKTEYRSDYDMMIVTRQRLGEREGTVETRIQNRFAAGKLEAEVVNVHIVSESISKLNDALLMGRYFYVDVVSEGVKLYDSGEYRLETPRELDYAEIKAMAKEYYAGKTHKSWRHYRHFQTDYSEQEYTYCAYDLHQVTEHLIKAIALVYILYGHKDHDLKELLKKTKCHTLELIKVFPRDTEEEERLFELLRRAYLEARYNPNFVVTKEDVDALHSKIERLKQIVEKVCRERFDYYDSRISEKSE